MNTSVLIKAYMSNNMKVDGFVKKVSLTNSYDGGEIYRESFNHRDIIKQQINLYNPDFIICCGTEKAFVDICYDGIPIEWKMTSRGVWWFHNGDCVVISFSHPEARIKDTFLYYALIDAVKEIKNKDINR